MATIYKIAPANLWREAERTGAFTGAPVDLADGFIHFSTASQVRETAALHFALGHPAVGSVVLGAQNPQEVERNVAALSTQVPSALWADLKAQHLLDTDAPVPSTVLR